MNDSGFGDPLDVLFGEDSDSLFLNDEQYVAITLNSQQRDLSVDFKDFEDVDKFELSAKASSRYPMKDITRKTRLPVFNNNVNRDNSFTAKYLSNSPPVNYSADKENYSGASRMLKFEDVKSNSSKKNVKKKMEKISDISLVMSGISDITVNEPPKVPPPPPTSLFEILLAEKERRIFESLKERESKLYEVITSFVIKT
jgi:hypothetical protein